MGYVPLISVCEGLRLHKGKIYDIFFSYVLSEDLIALSYINNNIKHKTTHLTKNMEVNTPSGYLSVDKLNFGDKIIVYDDKLKREDIRSVSGKRRVKRCKVYCALPISTDTHYIINGILIKNAGLS